MKEYDEKAPSKHIMYLDANNLYGWAMSQYLPTSNFKWMTDNEISKIDLGKYKADGKKGLIQEVDLEYPQELHNIHNDYPVALENNKKRSHTQLDSRKQVIAFQDRVITINIKEAQHPLKREKQVIDKSSIMLKISTKSMHRVLV